MSEHQKGKVTISLWEAIQYIKSLPPVPPEMKRISEQNRLLREARRAVPSPESLDL